MEELFWADQIARKIIESEKKLDRGIKTYKTEMGMGASGIPHVGSAGDGIRSYIVNLALQNLGVKSEFIAFSDDLDGLRKIPIGFPETLAKEIGKPVSHIPDPFGCHKSYGEHMSLLLIDAYKKIGVKYVLKKASVEYPKGTLDKEIIEILSKWKEAGEIIKKLTGQDKYLNQLPFLPFCEKCGKVYTTVATKFEDNKIYYRCDGEFIGKNSKGEKIVVKGCGHKGECGIRGGKLAWKVDFAARWRALKINYEAYGKDILDSVRTNDEICRKILNWEPPIHSFYEMFTERSGKKISKSKGNVFTPQLWLDYGSVESIRLLFLKKLGKSRVVDLESLPNYVDEVDMLEEVYFGKKKVKSERDIKHMKRLYEYVHFLKPPKKIPSIILDYNLLTNLIRIIPDEKIIIEILKKTDHIPEKLSEDEKSILLDKIHKAKKWVEDKIVEKEVKVKLNEKEKKAVRTLSKDLKKKEWKEKDLYMRFFEIAKEEGINTKDFFKAVYISLLKSERGPRLAPLILAIGRKKASERLDI